LPQSASTVGLARTGDCSPRQCEERVQVRRLLPRSPSPPRCGPRRSASQPSAQAASPSGEAAPTKTGKIALHIDGARPSGHPSSAMAATCERDAPNVLMQLAAKRLKAEAQPALRNFNARAAKHQQQQHAARCAAYAPWGLAPQSYPGGRGSASAHHGLGGRCAPGLLDMCAGPQRLPPVHRLARARRCFFRS
jgi:hypothetical protein